MESLMAGLATVSTIMCNHVNLEGRVSWLEGNVEHWEEVVNQIKLCFPIDINLNAEVEFLTTCSQSLLNSLKQRINTCSKSNTYFRTKILQLKTSIDSIVDKHAELQDTINFLGLVAGSDGANFSLFLLELKKIQDNFSHLPIELETPFAQELSWFGSKHGEEEICFYIQIPPPFALSRVLMFEFLICLI